MPSPELAIVVSPRDWAEDLHRWVADHGGALVRARIVGPEDALEQGYDVLVVEDLTSFLSPRLVDDVRQRGRRILGVFDPAEPWGRTRLQELGVDEVLPSTTPPGEVVDAVRALAEAQSFRSNLDTDDGGVNGSEAGVRGRAPVVAVGGPGGGCGRTEVAIGLAAASARRGSSVVVVDADDVSPAVAQRLGLPLHPNLRTAIDVVEYGNGQLEAALRQVEPGVEVLVGLPSPRDWHHVRPRELLAVIDTVRERADIVIADVGPATEELRTRHGSERFGLTRAALAHADVIVAVCAPTPVGVARLLSWVSDVDAVVDDTPLHGAVNAVPRGRFVRGELSEELWRSWPLRSLGFLPADRRVEEAAWRGVMVDRGPFLRAVDRLADSLVTEDVKGAAGASAVAGPAEVAV
ncbi:MAG: MinD/ParA family ATP-binding protein [Nitriliruptorales bacterium]